MENTNSSEVKQACPCDQVHVIKKGFSGSNAIMGFGAIAVFCSIIMFCVLRNQDLTNEINEKYQLQAATNHFAENIELLSLFSVLTMLGLFTGTIGMNNIYSICPKCGKKKSLTNIQ